MAMSKRENTILWVTMTIVVGWILWSFGVGPVYDDYTEQQTKLEAERDKFFKNKKLLEQASEIRAKYKKIEATFPKNDPDRTPEHAFIEDVSNLTQNIMQKRPDITPVDRLEMKDAPGYDMMSLTMKAQADLAKVSDLLRGFDQKGYLVQKLSINAPSIDKPDLTVEVTLARVVKNEPEETDTGNGVTKPHKPLKPRGSRRSG